MQEIEIRAILGKRKSGIYIRQAFWKENRAFSNASALI
jgi:hypothetical protein